MFTPAKEIHPSEKTGDTAALGATRSHSAFDTEGAVIDLPRAQTKRGIQSRHAQMIAIGGIIGTGLFVGTGEALAVAGPANLFLAFATICFFVYGMVTTVMTVGTYLPGEGTSMAAYASRYVSKSLGFAMGWLYWYSYGIIVAYEITAAALVIDYWPNNINVAVWLTIMLVVILGLNLMPVRVYAESEFWFASLKIIMIVGLLLLSFILAVGGGPSHERLGFRYWNDPGLMNKYLVDGSAGRLCAFVYALVFSMFSFVFGPELVVLTSGEMRSPRRNLPRAANNFIWRLIVFYVLSALAIGVICPSNASGLTNGGVGAAASPWTIAIREAGITVLPSVINGGIILSAWSSGNSYLYMSSRSLYSMACEGSAPQIFSRTNRFGVPVNAVLASSLYALLSYLNTSSSSSSVFTWLINITNTAGFISWICCCIIFLRFMEACKAQGITNLPYQSVLQPYATWVCLVFFTLLCLVNGFSVFFPGHCSTQTFVTSYAGIPAFIVIYLVHRTVHRNDRWAYRPEEVDLTTGLEEIAALEAEEFLEAERSSEEETKNIWLKKIRKTLG
ncbi:uncharacterized protein CDV56_108299 [Aspergillus thermomutatus]|uniref:Amino acid permease/ SLC12A domain-containing protein n=1 Tax=Aspergillus thermomutatus TaxID=41047 RepID=A0A397HAG6_ASPTH|nr:uncharacterized protein CDV56_108299 [Aspergillus thermomutatus]RHZ60125.1 hypothetical protein CDV56_108299 [Aspergillus thermomutatus]